jgi:hypothetical protein
MQAGEQEGEQPGVGDRCVTVTTNNNRSIDIAVLSHVNITFYRHLSYDIKDSRIIFGEKLRYTQQSPWRSDHLSDIKRTYNSFRHHRVLANLISSSIHYFSLHKTFGFRMKKKSLAFLLRICVIPGSIPYQWPIIREFHIFLWTLELKSGAESEICAYQFMISSHSSGRHCTA